MQSTRYWQIISWKIWYHTMAMAKNRYASSFPHFWKMTHHVIAIWVSGYLVSKSWQWSLSPFFSTSRPEQNGLHLADDIFKCIFLNGNYDILVQDSIKFFSSSIKLSNVTMVKLRFGVAQSHNGHYSDDIMGAMASQITSLTIGYSTVYTDADKKNIKAPRHWHLWGNSPGIGEFPAQMAINAENVSPWWRYHDCLSRVIPFSALPEMFVINPQCEGSLFTYPCHIFDQCIAGWPYSVWSLYHHQCNKVAEKKGRQLLSCLLWIFDIINIHHKNCDKCTSGLSIQVHSNHDTTNDYSIQPASWHGKLYERNPPVTGGFPSQKAGDMRL